MDNRLAGDPTASYWVIIKKTFKERFLVAVILIACLFLAIQYLPDIGFFCVIQIFILISLFEFYILFKDTKNPPYRILGFLKSLLMSASFLFNAFTLEMVLLISLFLGAAYPLVFLKKSETLAPFANALALTFLGPLYISFTINHLFLLRLENGAVYVYFLIVIIICGDTAAYFVGKFWGKHPLAPKASPRKTWEGTFGGLVFAGLGGGGYLFSRF
ncbi:phosphatidate cytidylyltransferase [Acidobacteriota bacterium]